MPKEHVAICCGLSSIKEENKPHPSIAKFHLQLRDQKLVRCFTYRITLPMKPSMVAFVSGLLECIILRQNLTENIIPSTSSVSN